MSASLVAYIDESGDDGLWRVTPIDPVGASEWFILSAVVVAAGTNRETSWVEKILSDLGLHQRRALHFQALSDAHKLAVCEALAALPVRCFVVMSNKRNMRRHLNQKAARVSFPVGRTWFYWWMTRLLLERVTEYCERRTVHEHGQPRLVRIEFARRGGLKYENCQGYFNYLRDQSKTGTVYLKQGEVKWSVVDAAEEIRVFDAAHRPGLQLADVVAGAFFQAAAGRPEFAIALRPRMAFNSDGNFFGYSVKLLPSGYMQQASAEVRRVFEFYMSQKEKRQAPGA
jgi:hypothetical protein